MYEMLRFEYQDCMVNIEILNIKDLLLMLAKGAETLPNKVAHDYKQLAKLYDAKNHKKGLKNAQKILQSHPDHPQTNAMKALFELELGDQAKAQATAKFALLKSMMKSMFCWHTYGSILKRRKNYLEAAKCFEQTLKFEKDNMQNLREVAALQIQIRDHAAHVATRWKILQLKPNMIHHWVAYAVSQHLKGDFEQLYKALSSIETMRLSVEMKPIQLSHYFIYRVIAYRDGEQFEKMYEQLHKNKEKILDEDIWHELIFKCCSRLGKKEQAQASIQFLIKKYPQNNEYIRKYQRFTQLSARELYKKLISQFNSKIAKVYELAVIEDKQEFKTAFSSFIKPYYQKNLISLFGEIQIVYEKSPFISTIEEVFLAFEKSLIENKYPDGTDAAFPTQYLWSLYLLAQHFSRNFQTLKSAYDYICKAIAHTNTVSEFYTVKAEIQYKMHNDFEALKTINEARKTDLADRYMNNICIKYLMKMMKPNIAQDVLKLFMRDELSLYELQNQWYIIEAGKSFLKMRKFAPGLRHLNFIEKQFIDMEANQYDFHTYCVRKWTLRQYIQYIAFNDNIYHDKKYAEAAFYAIDNLFEYVEYLKTEKKQVAEVVKEEPKKKKKNKKKVEVEEVPAIDSFKKKIDYDGVEYTEKIKNDPLSEAFVYAKNITSARYYNKDNLKENKLYAKAFAQALRTFIHFNKPLMAIRAHKKLILTKHDPYLCHFWTLKILNFLNKTLADDKTHEIIKENIKEYLNQIVGDLSIADYHMKCVEKLPEHPLKSIYLNQLELALHGKDLRQELIKLYKQELGSIIKSKQNDIISLQKVFYCVHKLQFYGQLTANQKQALNELFGQQTTYFTNWYAEIEKLPESTWSMFWLSDYDIKREEELLKKAEQKKQKKEEKKQK